MRSDPQLDAVDEKIVDLLRRDGRMPYREIARRLDVSESMIRKRVAKLQGSGRLRIVAVSDPLERSESVLATTVASVSPHAVDRVTDALARSPSVRYVAVGIGRHNVVVESIHENTADLHAFLQRELGLEAISSSETIQIVDIKKRAWDDVTSSTSA